MLPLITTLENGLTVITDPMPHLETACVGVWVGAGARNETEGTNGIAHMLEHMAFKGTARRTARGIAEEIERVGGFINAYTGREQTAYYARVLRDDVPLAIDILSDILQNSTFDQEELEREKGVVVQEIGQAEDTPDDVIFDHLQLQAYPAHPLGRPILGSEERVRAFTRDDLINQISTYYRAPSMLLVASGAVKHEDMVNLARAHLASLPSGQPPAHSEAAYAGGEYREDGDLEQAHLALAFKGVHASEDELYAMQVYSTVLGGGMSSRLFQEAREKRGLCYAIQAFGASYADTGLFGVYAGTSAADARELVHVIAGEMKALAADVDEDEIVRAKAQLRSGLLMGLEQASARCEQIAGQYLTFGRLFTPRELIARIDAVDATQVRRMAARILASGPMSLAVLGPASQLGSYDHVAARFC